MFDDFGKNQALRSLIASGFRGGRDAYFWYAKYYLPPRVVGGAVQFEILLGFLDVEENA